jgi:hypothetical protein
VFFTTTLQHPLERLWSYYFWWMPLKYHTINVDAQSNRLHHLCNYIHEPAVTMLEERVNS